MLRRRCVEHEVRARRVERIAHVRKGGFGVFVEIEVDVADFANALLRAAGSAVFQWVHADENVGT